jgi:hypothetical protein
LPGQDIAHPPLKPMAASPITIVLIGPTSGCQRHTVLAYCKQ